MKKLMVMLSGVLLLSLSLPNESFSQSCCISKPTCQVVTCATASPAASIEVKENKIESPSQVAQLTFAAFLSPVLNVSSVLFASQMVAFFNQVASCDPADCDPSCCFPPVCDPSSCDLSKCSAKKE